MAKLLEIRWHGRAGQGAKTAALVLAEAVISTGRHAQAFPEYGPERMGAPMQAFNRISDESITIHSHVERPKIVIVLDPTLMSTVDVKAGVPDDGIYPLVAAITGGPDSAYSCSAGRSRADSLAFTHRFTPASSDARRLFGASVQAVGGRIRLSEERSTGY
jgi:Pyruvate/2-oxoacid:ferredoxin oxidoreductase gamma subunit